MRSALCPSTAAAFAEPGCSPRCGHGSRISLAMASAPRLAARARSLVAPEGVVRGHRARAREVAARARSGLSVEKATSVVLETVLGAKGRGREGVSGAQVESLMRAVDVLEANGGVPDPTSAALLDGRWRLLYTTSPSSASPIQRTFTGVESFRIFQDIALQDMDKPATVVNVVELGGLGELRVEADASTEHRPIPGFVPRQGDGLILGLPLFGKSTTYPPSRRGIRIDFQFLRAAFEFRGLPFKIPYPVPFRLLGDEAKGFVDVTYLGTANDDGVTLRLSRGNKGTLFVLTKEEGVGGGQ